MTKLFNITPFCHLVSLVQSNWVTISSNTVVIIGKEQINLNSQWQRKNNITVSSVQVVKGCRRRQQPQPS